MSNETENLGRAVAWQIRDIPESIRDAVVDQARAEKINVGELVTRLVLDARAAGWTFTASNLSANPSNNATIASSVNLGDLARLIEATRAASESANLDMQKVAKDARSVTRQVLRQAKGLPPLQPRRAPGRALAAPTGDQEANST